MNTELLKRELDDPAFWLLVRKYATAPSGLYRDQRREAILAHIAAAVKKVEAA